MPSYIYDQLKKKESNISRSQEETRKWFRQAAEAVKNVNSKKILSNRPRLLPHRRIHRVHIGRMVMFYYDPKLKNVLPYYDTFPLVFPIKMYRDGFLGMNMHYLPRKLRASLLDSLYETYNNQHMDEKKKLSISYRTLQSSMRIRFFQPTIKRYLLNNVRSRFYLVDPAEWDMTLMLPTEKFIGASKEKVWADSMNQLGIGRR